MAKSNFYEEIKNAQIEYDVQKVYDKGINLYFTGEVEHPFACDGFLNTKTETGSLLRLIIEYKFDELLSNRVARAKVLTQVLFYIKRFEIAGQILPNVIMVGDVNECFVIHSNEIIKYLDEDVDWSVAPSNAASLNPDLVMKIAEDEAINPFIFTVDENFSFKDVADRIIDLAENVQRYVHVTEHNIATIFDYFTSRVIANKKKISANDVVAIFMGVITKNENYYKHPMKKNVLVTPFGDVKINGEGYDAFFSYFNRNYTPQEKMRFAEISDRLIEDTNRRNKGEFYTPTLFVDYAHDMIAKQFGEDWKEKYVVWDNSCFDDKTEFMSQDGWKLISDYKDGDKVLQFNQDGTTNFVTPIRYINQPYNGEWVDFKSSQVDIRTTSDHNYVVMSDKVQSGLWTKVTAGELYEKSLLVKNLHKVIPTTFCYDGNLEADENIIRLAVAINADGMYAPKTTLNKSKNRTGRNTRFTDLDTSIRDCYVISVKKERKKIRLRELFEKANLYYEEKEYGDYTSFVFHFPYFNAKHFPKEWYNLTRSCKEVIVDEVFNWDGSITESVLPTGKNCIRKTYSTSKKEDADFMQFVFLTTGHGCYFRVDDRKHKNQKANYQLAITSHKRTKLLNKTSQFSKTQSTEGDRCYCFQVDSGMLVVRRNNKVFVSGNCGSKNLTRDYYFKELYCSTLEQAELDISAHYNKEATSFQFDFLNDPLDKLPKGLLEAFEQNKPIIIFMNPPYATAASGKGKDSKTGIVKTRINEKMLNDKIGVCSANLYAQFLYRCLLIKQHYNLTNCSICLFCKPNYMSGPAYTNFRSSFFKEFKYTGGILFNAKHFADCSDKWGISFSIWTNGVTENPTEFVHSLVNVDGGEIVKFEEKNIYNIDGVTSCSDWVKPNEYEEKVDAVYLSSPISTRDDKKFNAYLSKDSLGGYINSGNNVQNSGQHCYISSASISTSTGALSYIVKENFTRICCGFSARKLVIGNWVNDKDEFMAPDTTNEKWQEFENDSIIYSLFNTSSNQSSLRQVEYKGKLWDIKNEFFWMSREEMMSLANESGNDDCYQDAHVSSDRYVYNLLQGITLSEEAQAVLDKACELVRKTFKYRKLFNEEHENYQINNWDCGWYQIKALAKEYAKDDLEQFKALYKKLADKMLPMVYEVGFLRK